MEVIQTIFPLLSENLQNDEHFNHIEGERSVALFVEKGSCRYSDALMFQAAVSTCQERKQVTLIRCDQFTALPPSVHGMPRPEPAVMAHLKIMYLSTMTQLISYFAKMHTTGCPDNVIVCNLDAFLADTPKDHKEHGIARLCAVIQDASGYMRMKSDKSGLVIASTCEQSAASLDAYKRFCSPIYTVQGSEDFSFEVTEESSDPSKEAIKITAYQKDNQIFMSNMFKRKTKVNE